MKRNHGIWLAIALILITGIGATTLTRSFVNRQAPVVAESDTTQAAAAANAKLAAVPAETGAQSMEAVPAPVVGTSAPPGTLSGEEATVAIPPVGKTETELILEEQAAGTTQYSKRLQEVEAQIIQYRANNPDQTTNTLKVNAEYELRLWEAEMDYLVDLLTEKLKEEDKEELLTEQRSWIRDRESKAMEASRKHSGSALESVEYAASMAEQTKTRIYELAESYHQQMEAP